MSLADPPGLVAAREEPGGSVQPPRLLRQVAPIYPEEARADGLHGDVSVLVEVDAAGGIVAVQIEQGPGVFQAAALAAASQLVFAPAEAEDGPIAATTRVWFHFAPPAPGTDGPAIEIVVHGADPDLEDTRARTTLSAEELERSAGEGLAQAIAQVAGVRTAPGTADVAKPIIRGQQERRLLVLYDGVRHESQKWGPDHAPEIDPFSAGEISVIRGAAGARYGPDAIGGVILIRPPPLRSEPGVGGEALASFASNGLKPYGALRLDAASASGLSLRLEGNAAVGASLSAPDYVLGNTASRTWNLGGAVGYRWDAGRIRASWHHHDLEAGVFYGVSNGTPADFQAQLARDVPVTAQLWSTSYVIDRPQQDVSHDVGLLRLDTDGAWGSLEATYALQLNRRQELEQVREIVVGPQYDFTLRTHSLDALYSHPTLGTSLGELTGGLGLQGIFQENVYRGYSLLPNHRSFGGGIFAIERLSLARIDLELGGRYDALSRVAFMNEDDHQRHVRRGSLDGTACAEAASGVRCPAAYDAASVSLGMLAHLVPGHLDLKLDLSSASRFPDVDELYLVGTAPSFPVYALGYPDLGVETSWGGSITGGLRLDALQAEVSGFGQRIDDYIYFAPELNEAGEPRFDVTIRGTWPRYAFEPIDAVVHGLDGSVQLGPHAPIGVEARGALVRSLDRASGSHLIGTPPDHLALNLVGRPGGLGPLRDTEASISAELVARQSRTDPDADFAPAPGGYALLGASVDTTVGRGGVRVGLQAHNLLNTPYRGYTSLLRYYADQPGRDVRIRVGADL